MQATDPAAAMTTQADSLQLESASSRPIPDSGLYPTRTDPATPSANTATPINIQRSDGLGIAGRDEAFGQLGHPDSNDYASSPARRRKYLASSASRANGMPPQSSSASSHGFERPSLRSVSGPVKPDSSAVPGQRSTPQKLASRQIGGFQEIRARFNEASIANPSAARSSPRSVSANPGVKGTNTRSAAQRPSTDRSATSGPLNAPTLRTSARRRDNQFNSPVRNQKSVSPSVKPPVSRQNRQMLFGEVVDCIPESPRQSGSSLSKRRRGSEGSMHVPNPMFPNGSRRSNHVTSPSLPNGWNSSPNLLALPTNRQGSSTDLRSQRSDSPASGGNLRTHSKIPISTRRSSFTDAPFPTRAAQQEYRDTPGANHQPTSSSSLRPTTPPMLLTSRRYDPRQNTGSSSNQAVKAVISIPTPKESPPLRRSRPRRSLSSASAADANRAVSHDAQEAHQNQNVPEAPLDSANVDANDAQSLKAVHPDQGKLEEPFPVLAHVTHPKSNPQLRIDVNHAQSNPHDEHSVAVTDFGGDTSPSLKMPGTFLVSPRSSNPSPVQGDMHGFDKPINGVSVESTSNEAETTSKNDESEEEPVQFLASIRSLRDDQPPMFANLESGGEDSLDQDGRETIQIMLGTSTAGPFNSHGWQPGNLHVGRTEPYSSNSNRDILVDGGWTSQPGEISQVSNILTADTASGQEDHPSGRNPSQVVSNSALVKTESDYSLINRVLDQYYESGTVTPEMIHEFQQDLLEKTPDLAHQNSYELAKLAIEDVIRDHGGLPPRSVHHGESFNDKKTNLVHHRAASQDRNAVRRENDQDDADGLSNRKHLKASNGRSPDINLQSKYYHQAGSYPVHDQSFNHGRLQRDYDDEQRPTPPPKNYRISPSLVGNSGGPSESPQLRADQRSSSRSRDYSDNTPRLPEIASSGSFGLGIQDDAKQDSALMLPVSSQLPPPTSQPWNWNEIMPTRSSPSPHDPSQRISPGRYSTPPVERQQAAGRTASPSLNHDVTQNTSLHSFSSQSQDTVSSNTTVERGTSRATPSPTPEDQKRLAKRKEIIRELVWTEYSYGNDMRIVEDIYKMTSRTQDVLSDDDQRILFGNSQQILAFSESFLDALKQGAATVYTLSKDSRWRLQRPNPMSDQSSMTSSESADDEQDRKTFIGDAFMKNLSQLEKVYGEYLKNQDAANQRLQKIQSLPKVTLWLKECYQYSKGLTQAWDLDSLMVKPVQRMLKYPLLLTALLETTPHDHPDYAALESANQEMMALSRRINESKKRADLVEQVVNNRKRKDSESRLGLSKAFGRRTEKLRQQVGLSDAYEDSDYKAVSAKFGGQFFQLQVAMRDVEKYLEDVQTFVDSYNDLVMALEGVIDAGPSIAPEAESRWRRFAMTIREITSIALPDHKSAVRKFVIDPMVTALKLHENPQRLMAKRKKRIVDYAKYKTIIDRGDKPDRKTQEQGEQYLALNDTLKEEFPKLFSLSAKLVEACLRNLIDLQAQWDSTWERKLRGVLEEESIPRDHNDIITSFNTDFQYPLAQAMSMGVCNGSLLAEASSSLSIGTVNDDSSSRRPRTLTNSKRTSDTPGLATPEFNQRHSGNFSFQYQDVPRKSGESLTPQPYDQPQRYRFEPAGSSRPPPASGGPIGRPAANSASSGSYFPKSSSNPQRYTDPPPQGIRLSSESAAAPRPTSTSTYYTANLSGLPPVQMSTRLSGVFSTAMPMPESPTDTRSITPDRTSSEFPRVLFLAASLFEFNIDRARKEGGYPYLTYGPGEVFDVIGEKGELWLAKNQDDPSGTVGWIWEKHFAKLMSDDA